MTLTSKERAILRKEANTLTPVFQIGKGEIDEEVVKATLNCLAVRELIKLKVLETSMYTAREAANSLAEQTQSEVVQVIGSKFVLYKEKEEESKYGPLISPAKAAKAAKLAKAAQKSKEGTANTSTNKKYAKYKKFGNAGMRGKRDNKR